MADRPPLLAVLAGIGLLIVCCAAPLLIGAIGAAGISALVAWGGRALVPIIGLLGVGSVLVLFLRRKHQGGRSRR
jgi:hypothetical protein